jgi:hypothetical protein
MLDEQVLAESGDTRIRAGFERSPYTILGALSRRSQEVLCTASVAYANDKVRAQRQLLFWFLGSHLPLARPLGRASAPPVSSGFRGQRGRSRRSPTDAEARLRAESAYGTRCTSQHQLLSRASERLRERYLLISTPAKGDPCVGRVAALLRPRKATHSTQRSVSLGERRPKLSVCGLNASSASRIRRKTTSCLARPIARGAPGVGSIATDRS